MDTLDLLIYERTGLIPADAGYAELHDAIEQALAEAKVPA